MMTADYVDDTGHQIPVQFRRRGPVMKTIMKPLQLVRRAVRY